MVVVGYLNLRASNINIIIKVIFTIPFTLSFPSLRRSVPMYWITLLLYKKCAILSSRLKLSKWRMEGREEGCVEYLTFKNFFFVFLLIEMQTTRERGGWRSGWWWDAIFHVQNRSTFLWHSYCNPCCFCNASCLFLKEGWAASLQDLRLRYSLSIVPELYWWCEKLKINDF